MAITLIGYRGCGKSSVAPLLADALGWSWIDTDTLIEQEAGMTIRRIFELEGESGFRQRETQALRQVCTPGARVVAAGGGAILSAVNRELIRAAGPVVWLQAPADVLAGRIEGDAASSARRPSLTGKSVTDEVADVLAARENFYRTAATLVVDACHRTTEVIAAEILSALQTQLSPPKTADRASSQETPE